MPDASPQIEQRLQEYSTPLYYTEKFEIFKRIHTQQNRELVRVNALYATKIQKLEHEVNALRHENLELRLKSLRSEHHVIQEGHELSGQNEPQLNEEKQSNNAEQLGDEEQFNDKEQPSGGEQSSDEEQLNEEEQPGDKEQPSEEERQNDVNQIARRVRIPVNYALPSIKKKLRKGDPHTFKTPLQEDSKEKGR